MEHTILLIYAFIQAIMQLIVFKQNKRKNLFLIEECEKLLAAVGRKLLAVSVSHREVTSRDDPWE